MGASSDVSVAADVDGLPKEVREVVQRSYTEVRALLDSLPPASQGWEAKVRDPKRCGLVKAVCEEDGTFEWVAPKWAELYQARGRTLLGLSEDELKEIDVD